MPKTGKRILSVKIKRMVDESPDTSYLGEYSNNRTSEFSIDRAHTDDCSSVSLEAKQAAVTLEHAQQTVADLQRPIACDSDERDEWDALEDAYIQLGELSEEVTECDCGERGDMGRHEYRYFNGPVENYKGESPEDIRKYVRQDYERKERLNRGDWCYIGIRAEAQVCLVAEPKERSFGFLTQTITSGGLWGIESDYNSSFADVAKEELSDLRQQLYALGFSKRAISTAFQNVEEEESE